MIEHAVRCHSTFARSCRELRKVIALVRIVSGGKDARDAGFLVWFHADESFFVQGAAQLIGEFCGRIGPNFDEDAVQIDGVRSLEWLIELDAFHFSLAKDLGEVSL